MPGRSRTLLAILAPNASLIDAGDSVTRGGKREGAGRPPRGATAARVRVTVWLAEEEHAELTAGLRDGEAISGVLRDGGLRLVRSRR